MLVVNAWLGGKRWVSARNEQEGEGRIREGGEYLDICPCACVEG